MLAAAWDTPYNIVYLVHIVPVILGTAMAFLAPIMSVRARRSAGHALQEVVDETASAIIFPAFFIAGMAGGALVGLGNNVYNFQQTWLVMAGPLWMAILALSALVYPPSWLRLVNIGDDRKSMLAGMLHLTLAIMLVVMTFKWR